MMPISNTKVLILNVNRTGWHSGNMIYDMEVIKKACDAKIYGPGWPDYKHNDISKIIDQLYGNDYPDIIYSYFTPNEVVRDVYIKHYNIPKELSVFPVNFSAAKCRKIFALSDFWSRTHNEYSGSLKSTDFSHCFCCFAPPFSNETDFYSFFNEDIRKNVKFIPMPRCIDTKCFRPYVKDKKCDILTTGAMGGFYPFRRAMHLEFSKLNGKRMPMSLSSISRLKYLNLQHCGFNFNHNSYVREKYAEIISSATILASCGGKYHLAFNKIFEAMACNTVYAGERPYGEKELYLTPGYNYIRLTPSNFVEQITFYLDRPNLLEMVSENGYQTAIKYHSIDARSAYFEKIINKL